jgi:hypothetical protein
MERRVFFAIRQSSCTNLKALLDAQDKPKTPIPMWTLITVKNVVIVFIALIGCAMQLPRAYADGIKSNRFVSSMKNMQKKTFI